MLLCTKHCTKTFLGFFFCLILKITLQGSEYHQLQMRRGNWNKVKLRPSNTIHGTAWQSICLHERPTYFYLGEDHGKTIWKSHESLNKDSWECMIPLPMKNKQTNKTDTWGLHTADIMSVLLKKNHIISRILVNHYCKMRFHFELHFK